MDARGTQKATGSGQLNVLGRGWSKSLMERMGFVMTKDTKTDKTLPQIRKSQRKVAISSTVAENSIPADLIVN